MTRSSIAITAHLLGALALAAACDRGEPDSAAETTAGERSPSNGKSPSEVVRPGVPEQPHDETLPPPGDPPTTAIAGMKGCPSGSSIDPPAETMEKIDKLINQRQAVEAVEALEKLLPAYPQSAALHCSLGGALLRKKAEVPPPDRCEGGGFTGPRGNDIPCLARAGVALPRRTIDCPAEPSIVTWAPKRALPYLRQGVDLMEAGCRLEGFRDYQCRTDLAFAFSRAGDHVQAVEASQSVLERWPRLPFANYDRACLHCLADDVDSCHDYFAKTLSLANNPGNCQGYFGDHGVCSRQSVDTILYDATCDDDLAKLRADPRYNTLYRDATSRIRIERDR